MVLSKIKMKIKKIVSLVTALCFLMPAFVLADTSNRTFNGVLNGKKKTINFTVDSNIFNYIYNVPRLPCPTCSSLAERDRVIITEATQKAAMAPLVNAIKAAAKKPDDRARLAISIVQNIPYDSDKSALISGGHTTHFRYPYETIYNNLQVCSENSFLIAFLLTELGYGAAVFMFPNANHEVAAIKCPARYSYQNTGYCFVEGSYRNIITYDTMALRNSSGMVLEELTPGGLTFSPKADYKDAQNLKKWGANYSHLRKNTRKKYNKLFKKYGL